MLHIALWLGPIRCPFTRHISVSRQQARADQTNFLYLQCFVPTPFSNQCAEDDEDTEVGTV